MQGVGLVRSEHTRCTRQVYGPVTVREQIVNLTVPYAAAAKATHRGEQNTCAGSCQGLNVGDRSGSQLGALSVVKIFQSRNGLSRAPRPGGWLYLQVTKVKSGQKGMAWVPQDRKEELPSTLPPQEERPHQEPARSHLDLGCLASRSEKNAFLL